MQADILIVADSPTEAAQIEEALRRRGHTTRTAANGHDALARIRQCRPALILSDIRMPLIDGLQLCAAVKQDPDLCALPVILLTSPGMPQDALAALAAGADFYIPKPYRDDDLVARIREALSRGEQLGPVPPATREVETLHRTILQASTSGFWLADLQGRLLEVNQAYCGMSGYSEPELLAMHAFDLDAGETAASTAAHIQKVVAQGEERFESRHRRKDGTLYDVEVSVQFQPAAGGRLACFLRDITERKRAAQGLLRSQERLGLALRSAGAGMWDWDVASGRIEWSRELFGLFGLDPKHTAAGFDAWRQVLHPEDREPASERITRALQDGTPLASEYRVVHADGTVRWISALGSTVRDNDGHPVRMSGICLDISARKQAQAVLAARLNLSDYASVHTLGELLTRTLDEAEALTSSAIGFFHFVAADQKTLSLQAWSTRTRQDGCTVTGNRHHYPVDMAGVWADAVRERRPVIHNDYGSLPQRRALPAGHCALLREVVVPILRHDRVVALLGLGNKPRDYVPADVESLRQLADMAWDIVQTKRAEDALRASEEAATALMNATTDAAAMMDRQGTALALNEEMARRLGRTKEATVGTCLYDLLPPEFAVARRAKVDAVVRTGKPLRFEDEREGRVTDHSIYPMADAQGTVTRVAIFGRDITERKRSEAERERLQARLMEAQKMESVGRLAGGVAHKFNNHLMGIMSYVELCRDGLPPEHPIRGHLDEISAEAQRSADIVRQLLAFARKQTIAPRALDLNEACANTLRMVRPLLGADIELSWQPGADLWTVRIDPSQFDQILTSLATNARDAIGGVGRVTFETRNTVLDQAFCAGHADTVPGDYVMLAISDTGRGMSKETLAHLFEPFFTTKSLAEGTGLNLATAYGVVRQNRGAISVISAPGQGTTFRIYLPRAVAATGAGAPAAVPGELPRGTETILLAEDEKSIRVTAQRFLSVLGYEVLAATGPHEALSLAAAHRGEIHLLISDVVMPEMSGRDLAQRLAASRPRLKCLFMSGYAAEALAQRGVVDQETPFLAKPFSRHDLARTVREVLGG